MFKPFTTCTESAATRRTALGLCLLPALMLAGCATATGPAFTRLEAPPPDKAQLYLYRKSALYAVAASYGVTNVATRQVLGELFNASYLVLPLDAGKHVISVDERGFASPKTFEVQAMAGNTTLWNMTRPKGCCWAWACCLAAPPRLRLRPWKT